MSERDRSVSGVVAKLVSDREIILNRGVDHGLETGDYIAVIDPAFQSVKDPETGEDLGGLRRIKAVLRVTEATEKLALAVTYRTKTVKVENGGFGYTPTSSIGAMFAAPKYETRVETMKLDPSAGQQISEEESVVHVSDPFELIGPEEAEDNRTVTLWR